MALLLLILIYLAFVSLGLPDSMMGACWPAMQPEFGVPYSFAGLLSIVIFASTMVSSLFSVRAVRRFGTGKVTVASVLMTALALLGISFAPSYYIVVLLCVPLGLGGGCVDAGLNAFVAEHYQSRHMSWLHCFWGVGSMIGPVIMSRSITAGSWRGGFSTVSSLQFILFFILLFSLPLWKRVIAMSNEGAVSHNEVAAKSEDKGMVYVLRMKGVKAALFSFFFYCATEATMGLWGASYLTEFKGASAAQAAKWVSYFYFGITFGRFITGFATIKLRNTTLIRLGQGIILLGALLMLLPVPVLLNAIGFVLVGLGCAPIFPCMLHETPTRFGKEDARVVMSFQQAVACVGSTIMPPLFGFLAEQSTFLWFAPFLMVCTALMFLFTERINKIMKSKQK